MEFEEMLKKYKRLCENPATLEVMPKTGENVTPRESFRHAETEADKSGNHPLERIKPGADVRIRVGRALRVSIDELPTGVIEDVIRRLTFKNPLWTRMKRAGKLTPEITRELTCYWEVDGHLNMTRGFASSFLRILQAHRLKGSYEDRTRKPGEAPFRFMGDLYAYQREAVDIVRTKRFGTISGQTGSGKKVIALYLAAKRQVPVMVIVQTRSQAYQWQDTAVRFLGLQESDIGIIGDGRQDLGRPFTIAISRSLHRVIDDVAESVGFLVVDQCDRVHLNVFFKFVRYIPSVYMLGLSIRRKRADKLTNLMHAYLGPSLHEIDTERVYRESTVVHPVLHARDADFDYDYKEDFKAMVGALAVDPDRNSLIVADVLAETASRRETRAAVMVERLIHLESLRKAFEANHRECALVSGRTRKGQLSEIFEMFNKGKPQIICITAKSFNLLKVDRITHLFVVSPVRHPENLCQAIGKLLWAKPGDEPPRVFDYRDKPVQLQGSYRGRVRVYRDMGVEIERK